MLALYFIMFKLNEVMLKFVNNRILFKYAICFSFIYYFECFVNFTMINAAFLKTLQKNSNITIFSQESGS